MRDTSAFNMAPGTLNAPAGYGGKDAPVMGGTSVADSAPQVTKAVNSQNGNGAPASMEAESVKNWAASIVIGGLVLLWVLGGLVFRNANL
jgi:hypothetical protein